MRRATGRGWLRRLALSSTLATLLGTAAEAAPVKVEFFFPANQSEAEAWKELVDVFNRKQNAIQVEAVWDTGGGGWGGFQERMLVRIAGGQVPDILRLSDEAFPEWALNGYLVPIDQLIKRDLDSNAFLPVALQLGRYGGQTYGLPQGIATRALAYNRTLLSEAGIEFPNADWRWDRELLEAARRLTKPEPAPGRYGIGFWFGSAGVLRKDIPEIIWSFGGEVFDANGNFRLPEEGGVRALSFLVDLVARYGVYPQDFDIAGRFVNGRLAMWNTGVWDVAYLRQQKSLDWDFAPTPGGPAGYFGFIQGNGIYVLPKGGKTEAAWEFLKFLTGEEGQRIFCLKYGICGVPLRRSLVPGFLTQPAPPASWQAFVTMVNRGRLVHQPPNATAVFNALNQGWGDMVRGRLAIQTWLDQVRPVVERLVQEGRQHQR